MLGAAELCPNSEAAAPVAPDVTLADMPPNNGAEEAEGAAAAAEAPASPNRAEGLEAASRPAENGAERFAEGSSSSSRALRLLEGAAAAAAAVVELDGCPKLGGCCPNRGARAEVSAAVGAGPEEEGTVGFEAGWPPKENVREELEAP